MMCLPYRPHPLMRSGHLQTLMVGLLTGERPEYSAKSFLVELEDGETLVVHEECGSNLAANAPLVVLIHGLGGDHRSAYLERLAPRIHASGFEVWRVDLRGCGAGAEHAWKPANAGRSNDLAQVLIKAESMYPGKPIHLVGFSLSGNIVLKLLGEAAAGESPLQLQQSGLANAIAVAPPVKLQACADNMDRLSRRLYTKFYLKCLAEQVEARARLWKQWRSIPAHPAVRTIQEFDARYTAPLSGYRSTEEYYRLASAQPWLEHIETPTEIVADMHDPIVPFRTIVESGLSPSTILTATRRGGHMGYFGLDEQGKLIRWLEHYVVDRLKAKAAASTGFHAHSVETSSA
ncbi:MAG: alpha/beta fold hydrolase [Planctomycetota bacterium]